MTKAEKEMGKVKHAVARKIVPIGDRNKLSPAHPRTNGEKKFGYSYEFRGFRETWSPRYVWFETEDARDQSYLQFCRKQPAAMPGWYRNIRKVNR